MTAMAPYGTNNCQGEPSLGMREAQPPPPPLPPVTGVAAGRIGRDQIERREVRRAKPQRAEIGGEVDVLDVGDPLLTQRSRHGIVPVGQDTSRHSVSVA